MVFVANQSLENPVHFRRNAVLFSNFAETTAYLSSMTMVSSISAYQNAVVSLANKKDQRTQPSTHLFVDIRIDVIFVVGKFNVVPLGVDKGLTHGS